MFDCSHENNKSEFASRRTVRFLMRSLDADFKEQVDIYARRGTFINPRAFPLALSHETVKVFLRNEEASSVT